MKSVGAWKERPILFRIGGLVLLTIVAAVAISFAVTLFVAGPPRAKMTVAEAGDGLLSDPGAKALGLRRTFWTKPPLESQSVAGALPASALAEALRVSLDNVRVRMNDDDRSKVFAVFTTADDRSVSTIKVTQARNMHALVDNARLRKPLLASARRMSLLAAAVRQPDGRWVMVEPTSSSDSIWRLRLLVALGFSALLVAPFAWLAARRLTQPIRALAGFARSMDLGQAGPEEVLAGPREVREAAAAITEMRTRLHAQSVDRSRMLAAVAHDLRTPLTGLRIRAEAAPEEERRKIVADITRMEAMIAQILSYASGEGLDESLEGIDLTALLAQVVDDSREQGLTVVFRPHPPLRVLAAPLSLRRAIGNLIDNAVRYGGSALVSVRQEGTHAVMSVSDRGPGLPVELLDRVHEPFFRGEASRNMATGGVGLGLTIAKDVVERHGGKLTLRNRAGGGLVVEVRLPLSPVVGIGQARFDPASSSGL